MDTTAFPHLLEDFQAMDKDRQQEELKAFEALLMGVRGLPEVEPLQLPPKTFIEIIERQHKEFIFSNLLAFYLNPNEDHGLGDLLLRAFLECLNAPQSFSPYMEINVWKEYKTEKGLRIDIVVVCGDLVLGIENKIWSAVHNDLQAYGEELERLAKEKSIDKARVYKVLLAPDKKDDKGFHGFKSVTYGELFKQVKPLLSDYIHLPSKYITYLVDMFFTLCKPKINHMENLRKYQQLIKFLSGKLETFNKLKDNITELRNAMVYALKAHYEESQNGTKEHGIVGDINRILNKNGFSLHSWMWGDHCIVYDAQEEITKKTREHAQYKRNVLWVDVFHHTEHGWEIYVKGKGPQREEIRQALEKEFNTKSNPSNYHGYDYYKAFPHDQLPAADEEARKMFLEAIKIIDGAEASTEMS